jgi:hypothetical protein
MVWNYISGDKYTLDDLYGYLDFFERDLISAEIDLSKAIKYEKYSLPNWRSEILKRRIGVEESKKNIDICKRAISEWNKQLL